MPIPQRNQATVDPEILRRVLAGDNRAIARLITAVEGADSGADLYLRALYPKTGGGFTIGVTGAPGSGKSTLVDCLAGHYSSLGKKVGVLAVDPSSPFTGGAILGDRIRMQARSSDPNTFIRSMATRGHLGGLSRATIDASLILDAAGFDNVLIETVGVGQDEVDIVRAAQVVLVLLVPGMGDEVQAMKAGIMEIGDVFVINKADRPGVEKTEMELNSLLSMSDRPDGWKPLVVRTVASENKGVAECVEALENYRGFSARSPRSGQRDFLLQRERVLDLAQDRLRRAVLQNPAVGEKLDDLAREVAERKMDPFTAAEELLRFARIEFG